MFPDFKWSEISDPHCSWPFGLLLLPVKKTAVNFCVPGRVDPAAAVEQVPDLGGEIGGRVSGKRKRGRYSLTCQIEQPGIRLFYIFRLRLGVLFH